MPKSLERLIDLLPLPFLLAAAAIFSLAWLVKELRPHEKYGLVLRDRVFQRSTGLILSVLVITMLGQQAVDWLRAPNFGPSDRGLCIAAFQGDKDTIVQRQTAEYLKSLFTSDDSLNNVRVALYKEVPTSHDDARILAQKHGALATIWGTVIPGGGATMVVFNVSIPDQKKETRKLCPQYPDIHDFTTAMATFIKATAQPSTPSGDKAQTNYIVSQLRDLKANNDRLNNVVAQLQRNMSASLNLRNPTPASSEAQISPPKKRDSLEEFVGKLGFGPLAK